MKIQCSCGAKYDLDVLPEMAAQPVRFVCTACGLDSSEFVNQLIRQELGQTAPVAVEEPKPAPQPEPVRASAPVCSRHPGQMAEEKCRVCGKPICPRCMELFGYVCSPLCRTQAENRGIRLPAYGRTQLAREAKQWNKVVHIAIVAVVTLVSLLGFWIWYSFVGGRPKPVFSVRFPAPSYSGKSLVAGKDKDQLVFLHGGTLARYNLKTKEMIWSRELIDRKQLEAEAVAAMKAWSEQRDKLFAENPEAVQAMGRGASMEETIQEMEIARAASLALYLRGDNLWVAQDRKLVRYDWNTGNPGKELAFEPGWGGPVAKGDELVLTDAGSGRPSVTRVNLATGESHTESIAVPTNSGTVAAVAPAKTGAKKGGSGLPVGPAGRDGGKALDPAKAAEQASHLSLPGKIALPAVLAINANQERALTEMQDSSGSPRPATQPVAQPMKSWVPTPEGVMEFSVRVVESRMEEKSAMKAPSGKSVLDGNLTAGNTLEAANEILNDMQRSRGGDKVLEDNSRYQVTLGLPDGSGQWQGEVVGQPSFFPLQTVNVLTANKRLIVFDKSNKKLWESPLSYNVVDGAYALEPGKSLYGQGPCVERKRTLYVYDEGTLTAFDMASGNVRWRLPSVGTAGLFFDEAGQIYVNTTSAGADRIKYSRQIDVARKVENLVFKIDGATGKVLWKSSLGGMLTYVSGKYLYTCSMFQPPEDEGMSPLGDWGSKPAVRIRRLNPKTGAEIWEHFEQRCPVDAAFDQNTIRLVFKKEVEVLKYLSF
jgi:hypothetical protein